MIFLLGLVILVSAAFTQETRKGLIGIAIGPSIPLGDFGDSEFNNEDAGYAKTGMHLNFNFSYKFNENLGIAALWTGNAHAIDAESMIELFWATDQSLNWELETEAWSSGSLMGGLLVSFPFNKIDFDIKGLIGFSSSTIPNIIVNASDGFNTVEIKQNEADAMALAINLGAGFRYNVSEKMALTLNMDYFTTKPEFEVATTSDFGFSSNDKIKQAMNMLNFSFGIGYRLK